MSDSEDDADDNFLFRLFRRLFPRRTRRVSFAGCMNNEYEYIIEKLAIKRVRGSLISTSFDIECRRRYEEMNSAVVPPVNESAEAPKSKVPSLRKKLRFTRVDDESGGEGTSGETFHSNHIINRLTAFHPHLKESERPPKDPLTTKRTKSIRSFAEELTEFASKKDPSPGTSKQK
ncbi:uncharacterized protein LOC123273270 isoform X1 [Cotesia glomerata]|uniref:uncharacterized protein LOC123273270 isoform X1 n=2 Tax=Cotesia glomerata TaxID=32391 RepID=UPI001D022775|nr:uncharacterized protein LOC123273270 isoform X1 [Cotesia glomerata]